MKRTRHQLAPAMPRQKIVDRAVAGCVPKWSFVGRLEIVDVQHLAGARRPWQAAPAGPFQRAECQHDIKVSLDRVERGAAAARSCRVTGSKKGKVDSRRYCAALRRLRNAHYALDPAIRSWFSLAETVCVAGSTPSSIARSQSPKRFSLGRHRLRGATPAATRPR